ncbi:MAG: hypothetical protein COA47_10155 [Robiginitomaculum sp.]|nr:MAG: hypothetical protein COA47_10155 [Robiginitomaculum sp.]
MPRYNDPAQLKWYLDVGCLDYSERLGFVSVPGNYALLLNSDYSHFFYIKAGVEDESCVHWDKWAVYRWIKQDAKPFDKDITS